jgi:metal-responsive CopG/Arc/MetJ family transcriptional regulator
MKPRGQSQTVRRSVALPKGLVDEVTAMAPREIRQNLNRLVTMALKEYVARQKARRFEEAMARMASDPAIRSEGAAISKEFAVCESDGLKDG